MDEVDLDAAAQAGIIGEDQAIALRRFMAQRAGASIATQEKFQLASSLMDVTRAIGFLLLLVAISFWIGGELTRAAFDFRTSQLDAPEYLIFAICALASIVGATLRFLARQPDIGYKGPATAASIMVGGSFCACVMGVMVAVIASFAAGFTVSPAEGGVVTSIGMALFASIFLAVHWRLTRFPVIPAYWGLLIILIINLQIPEFMTVGSDVDFTLPNIVSLSMALPILVAAIWIDLTDIRRETRRSQVAFWLHIVAGTMLARASFALATGTNWSSLTIVGGSGGFHVLAIGLILGAIGLFSSLILDRRSMLVAILIPLGAWGEAFGLAVAGGLLILISSQWQNWRAALLCRLPAKIVAQVPRIAIAPEGQRPTRRHADLRPKRWLGRQTEQ